MKRGRARPRRPPARSSRSGEAGEPSAETTCTLRVDRLASGGDGVATRDDGKTVFVEDGVPGELVLARVFDERKRFARARVDELLEPSADRVRPRCPHFGVCGGCTWQHLRYSAQVAAKARILRDALERIGGFTLDSEPAMTASPVAYGYRGRARVRTQGGRVGFRERASHRLCAIEACPVLAPALEAAVLALPSALPEAASEEEREWSLCAGTSGAVSVAPAPDESAPAPPPEAIELEVGGDRIGLDARTFSQANVELHAELVRRVAAALFVGCSEADVRDWTVLELHAGVGFFTRALTGRVGRIVAVESDRHACVWLSRNVSDATDRVEVIDRSFESARAALAGRDFDAVLLDPPRTGLAPAELDALAGLAPPRIVYLSCDPATLARDARGLAEAAGYRLDHVEGFDLFPQTPHTEGLVRLIRDA